MRNHFLARDKLLSLALEFGTKSHPIWTFFRDYRKSMLLRKMVVVFAIKSTSDLNLRRN